VFAFRALSLRCSVLAPRHASDPKILCNLLNLLSRRHARLSRAVSAGSKTSDLPDPRLEIENPSSLGSLQNIYLIFGPQQSASKRFLFNIVLVRLARHQHLGSAQRAGHSYRTILPCTIKRFVGYGYWRQPFPTSGRFAEGLSAKTNAWRIDQDRSNMQSQCLLEILEW
jgi:hypothetical protein